MEAKYSAPKTYLQHPTLRSRRFCDRSAWPGLEKCKKQYPLFRAGAEVLLAKPGAAKVFIAVVFMIEHVLI